MKTDYLKNPYAMFDFDGTLVDSNAVYTRFCEEFVARYGKTLPEDFVEKAIPMSFEQCCEALNDVIDRRESTSYVIEEFDLYTSDFCRNHAQFKPYALQYLQKLYKEGIRIYVVSSSPEEHIRAALSRLGGMPYVERIVTPALVGGLGKSKPDIYRKAAELMGAESYDSITFYDDSLDALRTAMSVGMKTVGVYDDAGANNALAMKQYCTAYIISFNELL